jgi:hypothetical protein
MLAVVERENRRLRHRPDGSCSAAIADLVDTSQLSSHIFVVVFPEVVRGSAMDPSQAQGLWWPSALAAFHVSNVAGCLCMGHTHLLPTGKIGW